MKDKKLQRISCIILALFFLIDVFLFENRISLWIYFNKKNKTLPISFSKKKIFYITSNIVNMENIIENYIEEMKKLIDYLGEKNIIISIVEYGDNADNTRIYLEDFKNYLNEKKILLVIKLFFSKKIHLEFNFNIIKIKYVDIKI